MFCLALNWTERQRRERESGQRDRQEPRPPPRRETGAALHGSGYCGHLRTLYGYACVRTVVRCRMACGIVRTVLREHVRCVNGPLSLFATLRFKCCPTSVRPSMRMWHSVRLMLCCRVRKAWPITQFALVQTNWVSRYIFVVFRRSTKQISSSELAISLGVQIFRNVWTPVVLTTLFWGTFVKSLLTAAPLCCSKTVSGKLYEG